MIYSPSYVAREAWYTRLSDSIAGFNPTYLATSSLYVNAQPIVIDFSAESKNFFRGRLDAEDIESAGTFQFPLICLYATAGKNTNDQKFQTFSGPVRAVTDIHLSGKKYKSSRIQTDFETWCDAVEHTTLWLANVAKNQRWGAGLSYNGDSGFERLKIRKGGENWLQTFRLQLTFTVNLA